MESNPRLPRTRKTPVRITALTAAVLVAVVLLNLLFGMLAEKYRLISDLTSEGLYTVDEMYFDSLDAAFSAMDAAENGETVEIRFCEDPDVLIASTSSRYVYYTALELQKRYPDRIRVTAEDIRLNPSSVQKFLTNSASHIYQSNVIVSAGTEFRVLGIADFFYYDSEDYSSSTPIGYCGDKNFAKAILSVTRAEAPVCCLITNHGETYSEALVAVLTAAGYDVVENFDFRRDALPADCRLLLCVAPQSDFYAVYGSAVADGYDEIDRLDAFLDEANSFAYFFDPAMPELATLEEYLAEWGVGVARYEGESFTVADKANALNASGTAFAAQYETTGLGASMLSDLLDAGKPGKALFSDCASIDVPDTYRELFLDEDEAADGVAYSYLYYSKNGVDRSLFNLFTAGESATASTSSLTANTGSDRVMTLTMEYRLIAEDSGYTWVRETSYVLACASVDFVSDAALTSAAYANTDVLLSVFRNFGARVTAQDNAYRWFRETTVGTYLTFEEATFETWAVLLSVIPAAAALAVAAVVIVRRKRKA